MFDMFSEVLLDQFASLIFTIVSALFGLLTAYVLFHINGIATKLKEKTNVEIANQLIDRVTDLASTTVLSLEQTLVSDLREQIRSGVTSKEELARVGRIAVERVLGELNSNAKKVLEDTVGDLEKFVTDKVEGSVQAIKLSKFGPQQLSDLREGKN